MAAKKKAPKKQGKISSDDDAATTKPTFPYSNKPNSLRRFLELVPNKPRPSKINTAALKAWGLRDSNDTSIIRVLKALRLVSPSNEPTETYISFMSPEKGPAVLAAAIREVWAPLFEHSHQPYREDDATLRRYFNIHSGGGESTLGYQVQTFKAACDHADFGAAAPVQLSSQTGQASSPGLAADSATGASAAIHIDLHIHLPENKSRRDYEYIFEDIARYIFGRDVGVGRDERA